MPTLVLQPDSAAGYDAHIRSDAVATNYSNSIVVGETSALDNAIRRALIKFDLSSIPAKAKIVSAALSLTISADNSSNARNFRVYRLLRNWVPSQATWNVWSTGNNWTTAGAGNAADYNNTAWATTSFTATETVDTVKDFVLNVAEFSNFLNGTYSNFGWIIRADTELNDAYSFYSSSTATASYRPKLTVEYTVNNGNFFALF